LQNSSTSLNLERDVLLIRQMLSQAGMGIEVKINAFQLNRKNINTFFFLGYYTTSSSKITCWISGISGQTERSAFK
jgi:hypothetical protein